METAYVVQMTGSGVQLVDFYLSTQGSRTLVHPGFNFPMHASAVGKAIFAFQSDEIIDLASKGRSAAEAFPMEDNPLALQANDDFILHAYKNLGQKLGAY